VSFHLLQTAVRSPTAKIDLNCYNYQIVHCLKSAASVSVVVEFVRFGTRKPLWNVCPEVEKAKQRAKFWLRLWIACDRPKSGKVFKIKQNSKCHFRSSLHQARLKGLDGPSDWKSWSTVINSSKCMPATVSIIKISDYVAHFPRVFSTFNHSIQSMFSSLLHNTVPQVLRQVHILSVSSGDIYRVFKSVKKSSAHNMDGLCYNQFTIKRPLLLSHIQLPF
jgi:hypothetical protein